MHSKLHTSTKYFKLDRSTSQGQHKDNINEGQLTELLNSVVDHRSFYVHIQIMHKQVEPVCDSGESVTCLSENFFYQFNEIHEVITEPSKRRLNTDAHSV